jgi:hypothetical protein
MKASQVAITFGLFLPVFCFDQTQTGNASYNATRSGFYIAHSAMSFGSRVKVTNLLNNKEVIAVVINRIPASDLRIADIYKDAADAIGMSATGYTRVRLEELPPVWLSDEAPVQTWEKKESRNRWGDLDGSYTYLQYKRSSGFKGKEMPMVVQYSWTPTSKDWLNIMCAPDEHFQVNPAATLVAQGITFSLRSNGVIKSYKGFIDVDYSDLTIVVFNVYDQQLIRQLQGPGQWEALIEGRDWYIRTSISGNLPE